MEAFNIDAFLTDSNSLRLLEVGKSSTEDPTQLPGCIWGGTAALSNPLIDQSYVSNASLEQTYGLLDGSVSTLLSVPRTNWTLANQTISSLEDPFSQDLRQGFTNANSQHAEAHEVANIQSLQRSLSSSNYAWLPLSMSKSVSNASETQWQSPVEEPSLLKCTFPGCADQQVFPTESALKKHQDKHNRPYTCIYAACQGRSYGDKGSLQRHEREAHGFEVFKCPVRSCSRHRKGFARKYNLVAHQRSCHGRRSSDIRRSFATSLRNPTEDEEEEDDAGDSEGSRIESNKSVIYDEPGLRTMLCDLRAMRDLGVMPAKIDGWIASLESVLDVRGGISPRIRR